MIEKPKVSFLIDRAGPDSESYRIQIDFIENLRKCISNLKCVLFELISHLLSDEELGVFYL